MFETLPMPLDALGAAPGGLDEFRVTAPGEIATLLRRLYDSNVELNLHAGEGVSVAATVWTTDAGRGSIGFRRITLAPSTGSGLETQVPH